MNNSLLITGASGFIGSTLVEEALQRGFEVWAAVRPTSSRRYLTDPRIHFIELDLGNEAKLAEQLHAHVKDNGPWQYVVHAAGATKCRRPADFFRVNTQGTLSLARQLVATGALRSRFVFISSLSICGALHETDYAAFTEADVPQPNTAYGRSKVEAEEGLKQMEGLDYIILRPTGVYGPRERDYFLMAKSIGQHIDFSVGRRPPGAHQRPIGRSIQSLRWRRICLAHLFRPPTREHGRAPRGPHLCPPVGAPRRLRPLWHLGTPEGKDNDAQSRQIQNHETTQLAV